VLALPQQDKGVGARRRALFHGSDHVRAHEPMGFGQIRLRPLGGMIGMRMVEAYNLELLSGRVPLDGKQLLGIDLVAVLRAVSTRVPAPDRLLYYASARVEPPQQRAATLEGIRLLAMLAKCLVVLLLDNKHYYHLRDSPFRGGSPNTSLKKQ